MKREFAAFIVSFLLQSYALSKNGFCLAKQINMGTKPGPAYAGLDVTSFESIMADELEKLSDSAIGAQTKDGFPPSEDSKLFRLKRSTLGVPEVVSVAKDGIDAANGLITLYDRMVNLVIPWSTFERTMIELREARKQYSNEAAGIVGTTQSLLLDSSDQYHSSKEEVSEWCQMAVRVLGQYLRLFKYTDNVAVAEAQKLLLLKVLDDGSEHVSNAMQKLETSRMSFNEAYGHLTSLKTQLHNDFTDGSAYYTSEVDKLRKKAYAGAGIGAIGGGVGLAISYSIAAGVVEGKLVPNLERAFEETKEQFDRLQTVVKQAQNGIDSAKLSIQEEIRVLRSMSAKIDETETFAETWAMLPSILFEDLKKSTSELISMCNTYIMNAWKDK